MSTEAERVLEEALHLKASERAKIAAELLASLDEQQKTFKPHALLK